MIAPSPIFLKHWRVPQRKHPFGSHSLNKSIVMFAFARPFYNLCRWNLNLSQTIHDKIKVLLGATWGNYWELHGNKKKPYSEMVPLKFSYWTNGEHFCATIAIHWCLSIYLCQRCFSWLAFKLQRMLFLGIFQHDQILELFLYIFLVNIIQHSTFLNKRKFNNVFFNMAKVRHFAKLKRCLWKVFVNLSPPSLHLPQTTGTCMIDCLDFEN